MSSVFEAVKARSMKSVLKPDYEYVLRHIFRWYSKTFSTPLEDVDDLPLEDVLVHYYEEMYENMDEQTRLEAIQEIIQTDAERKKKLYEEDARPVEEAEFAESVKLMKQFAPKPKPLVIAGDDEVVLQPVVPTPVQLPTVDVKKNEMGLPEFSLKFKDSPEEDNLIPDDIERFSTMREPDEEE